ncbi:hypothetical protein J421_0789 [Gemmatirosa kalamazoonensis]|uniref:Uncharacterized protein n=1 Tax=Gemmatirosa kalamazoonensis TaxID=861299 RepID=W0RC20_9BACT|nr:hypothetical protein J421_0789 [Gemmatirosa kalamazoonensis]
MPPRRVSEASPVQVYLGPEEQARLAELAEHLKATKSEVLRRGLLALERELGDPRDHPALRLIGMIKDGAPYPDPSGLDPARDHDRYLADMEERSWHTSRTLPRAEPDKPGRRRRAR